MDAERAEPRCRSAGRPCPAGPSGQAIARLRTLSPHASGPHREVENAPMLRLIGIVVSIGLADSINPTTIGPALYLATGERARGRVAEFTFSVFAVYLLGGAAIAVGAGQLIRPLLPHPRHHIADVIEMAAGVALIVGAATLWRHRHRLAHRDPPDFDPHGHSSWV